MKEVTLLQSNLLRLQISIALLCFAASFRVYVAVGILLVAVVWYASKTYGELK